MWEAINQTIFLIEIILLVIGILFVWGKKNTLKTFIFLALVFVLNFTVYITPVFYEKFVLGESRNFLFYLFDVFPVTIKSLVGDGSSGMVEWYCAIYPLYAYIYLLGLVLGFLTTSYAVISTFGYKILNVFKVAGLLNGKSCDIISGNSAEAVNYAKSYKKTIIVLPKDSDKSAANDLINSGYNVIRRKITKEFLESRVFNTKTKYNFIFPGGENEHYDIINDALSCSDTCCNNKNIHFYIETDENAIATEKSYIEAAEKNANITLFSRNELIARTFVEKNPVTKDMPADFFEEDTSLKEDVNLNMFILGFSALNKEIYRQFIVNNQFCKYKDGEYKVYPVNYYIYDKNANEKNWEINGLSDTLNALSQNKEAYFALPDMPYSTECINESSYEFDCLKEIVKKAGGENSFSYILIDTGSIYKNIEIAERFKLLFNTQQNFRIFIYNNSKLETPTEISCYGNTEEIYTQDVIVNEDLVDLARSINAFYCGSDNWNELTYFDKYSNISLASNLRFKLNLINLDYVKNSTTDDSALINDALKPFEVKEFSYGDYFERSTKNALLAQEHFRWNAYHLLLGYLPMKKIRITVGVDDKTGKVTKKVKNNMLRKHACLTTFKGLDELSQYLANKVNEISRDKVYNPEDFDYYKYDALLYQAIPGFFKDNNCSVVKKLT